ncbi:MAG: HAMP domain-containing sensor histidine kinase [Gemmatimonadaceae bacterium]|nr:HAMP domain-containing sensor histidine kinase [Gemmatimonadaceae bacterium]
MPPRPFRARLFSILLGFALIPTVLLTAGLVGSTGAILPLVGASAAWDSVASTGDRALDALRAAPLTDEQRAVLAAHEQELSASVTQARRVRFVSQRASAVVAVAGLLLFAVLAYVASRVAGHLSRQLSRPVDELTDWTERIAKGEALPSTAAARGAPEFEVLRTGMRAMASELEVSRARALDAERLRAMRESARQVAHELKNPLTPIRLALLRVAKAAPPEVRDAVDVLETETRRIDTLARNFAQFGRLPEGAMAPVDIGELVRYTARATVPDDVQVVLEVADPLPAVLGQYEALSRALSNVLLNAVDAVRGAVAPQITVHVQHERDSVRIAVSDNGSGITAEALPRIWEPYVTTKPAGTGLGLAIVRQTVEAHAGTVFAESRHGGGTTIGFLLPGVATPQPVHP